MPAKQMLSYIQNSEFMRESARLLAKNIADSIDIRELVGDVTGYTDDLLMAVWEMVKQEFYDKALAGAIAAASSLGLSVPDTQLLEKAVLDELSKVITDTSSYLVQRVENAMSVLDRASSSGVAPEVIGAILDSEKGAAAIVGPVEASIRQLGGGMVSTIENTVMTAAQEQTALEEPATLFVWNTAADDNVCQDVFENSCDPRDGEELQLDEWGALGEPGAEHLICTMFAKGGFSNCRCWLDASGDAQSASPTSISSAVSDGKSAAQDAYGAAE
jgi:hypothetical protein